MKLTTRIQLLLLSMLAVSVGATYAIQRYVVYERFLSAERDAATEDLRRCVEALRSEERHLEKLGKDWAFWDDMYKFMEHPTDEFINANLGAGTLVAAEVDAIYVLDLNGAVAWSRLINRGASKGDSLPDLPRDWFDPAAPLLRVPGPTRSVAGIANIGECPMIVTALQILTSNLEGPPRGTLIMGRFLNARRVHALNAQIRVNFQVHPAPSPSPSEQRAAITGAVIQASPTFRASPLGDMLHGSIVYPGIDGEPVLVLDAAMPRTIAMHGRLAVLIDMVTTGLVLLIALLVLGGFLRRAVVRPIRRVRELAAAIGHSDDLSRRLPVTSKDEIGALALEFNKMLARLEMHHEEQAQTEAALLESHQRMDAVWEATGNALFVVDPESRTVVELNRAATGLLGKGRDEVIGKVCGETLGTTNCLRCWESPDNVCRESTECVLNRADGVSIPLLRTVTPFNVVGRPFLLECLTDISVQKAAELAARASEDRLRTVIDSSKDAMIAIDREGHITIFNPAAEEMFRRSRDEMMGRPLTPLMPAEYRPRHDEYVHGYFTAGLPSGAIGRTLELPAVRADGTSFPIELTLSPGQIDGEEFVLAVVRDVTSRRAVEQALRDNESLLRATLESTADGILVVDMGGNVTHWNTRFLEMWRIPDELAESRDNEKLLDFALDQLKDPDAFLAKVKELYTLQDEDVATVHFKDGRVFERFSFPLVRDRKSAGRVWNFRDITSTVRVQEELRGYAEAQAVLLREVNHRVKNNLSAIIAMLHKEEDRASATGSPEFVAFLNDLVARVRGLATVHEMLSATGWRPLVLKELCRRIVAAALQGLPLDTRAALEISGASSTVTSDEAHHLTLVINELATNSVKHALRGRQQATIAVHVESEGDRIRLTYRDDGPGFPGAVLEGHAGSTGVGFELIRGIVAKNLRGTVKFSNDNGAVTHISLGAYPVAPPAEENRP